MEKNYLYFDNASTTKCCEAAEEAIQRFTRNEFGNPSSNHALGQEASRAIRKARSFFAAYFHTHPDQIIFTGSGTEADNLAIYGVALEILAQGKPQRRLVISSTEHPAVKKTALSLTPLGFDVQQAPVDTKGQVIPEKFIELIDSETALVSIHQVNNIVGSLLLVEDLARLAKEKNPFLIFHTDAVQAFGKVAPPPGLLIDLISISSHKIEGPKGVGALVVLNQSLLKSGMRPLIWGGEQENGLRSGTQNAGLIAGFHVAAESYLKEYSSHFLHALNLKKQFKLLLQEKELLSEEPSPRRGKIYWNSCDDPKKSIPHIINLSVPTFPPAALAKLLEERGCLISTGSACSSKKTEPDSVLRAMGLAPSLQNSAIRVSFSRHNHLGEVEVLVNALAESIQLMTQLLHS